MAREAGPVAQLSVIKASGKTLETLNWAALKLNDETRYSGPPVWSTSTSAPDVPPESMPQLNCPVAASQRSFEPDEEHDVSPEPNVRDADATPRTSKSAETDVAASNDWPVTASDEIVELPRLVVPEVNELNVAESAMRLASVVVPDTVRFSVVTSFAPK
jgi:hypothetical protein